MATDVAEGSSSAVVEDRYPPLEPKHDIFLSHSGIDKDFTDLLNEKLKDRGYTPFFDKERGCLPPGANASVANSLFDAARQCRVLIVILSEAFFTNSEWPMLELSAFVQSPHREALVNGKSAVFILPVYLGLSKDDVKDGAKEKRWCKRWSAMKEKEVAEERLGSGKPRIDIEHWEKALQVLVDQSGKYTSCEYTKASGYSKLLTETVNALCCQLPTRDFLADPAIKGRERICNVINWKIEESVERTKDGVCKVGLHGMSGIGKTTICKELCAIKYCEFVGRVCHIELRNSAPGSVERESRKEEVMRKLTHISPPDIRKNDLGRVREEKVFLALDNVKPEYDSIEEAREYLDIWEESQGKGSVVIVTAQYIGTLGELGIDEESNYLEMPELTEEDAKSLFLSKAAPECELKPEDDEDIQYCLKLCYFSKALNIQHYHPLALVVLGAQLRKHGPNPRIWKEKLSLDDTFNQKHDVKENHPIFRILRRGFDMLRDEDKRFFMDVALFSIDFLYWDGHDHPGANFFDWMLMVHPKRDLDSIREGLQVLKERAVIVDDAEEFSVHDLFYAFAKAEAQPDAEGVTRWLYCNYIVKGDGLPDIFCKTPAGNCWEEMERISLKVTHYLEECRGCQETWSTTLAKEKADAGNEEADAEGEEDVDAVSEFAFEFARLSEEEKFWTNLAYEHSEADGCDIFADCMEAIKEIKWEYFSNVVVLHIHAYSYLDLDLRGLGRQLRSLRIFVKEGKLVGLGKLSNLRWLELIGMHWATCAEDIVSLKQLRVLRMEFSLEQREALNVDNLKNCTRLQELEIHYNSGLEALQGLKASLDLSEMSNIRKVKFSEWSLLTELVLGKRPQSSKLEELRLTKCKKLRLPNLAGLVSMQILELSDSCFEIEEILGLQTMTGLRVLIIEYAPNLLKLPQLAGLIALERLRLVFLPKVREFPDIRHLKKLQKIEADTYLRDILITKTDIYVDFWWTVVGRSDLSSRTSALETVADHVVWNPIHTYTIHGYD